MSFLISMYLCPQASYEHFPSNGRRLFELGVVSSVNKWKGTKLNHYVGDTTGVDQLPSRRIHRSKKGRNATERNFQGQLSFQTQSGISMSEHSSPNSLADQMIKSYTPRSHLQRRYGSRPVHLIPRGRESREKQAFVQKCAETRRSPLRELAVSGGN